MTLEECLKISDVVISAVPSQSYKIPTKWLKDGSICVSVAQEKNFDTDVRDRVSLYFYLLSLTLNPFPLHHSRLIRLMLFFFFIL